MPFFQRRPASPRRTRPHSPSCRGGASSLLRLAQPAPGASDKGLPNSLRSGFAPLQDFAPSQWLVGH
jgi:hypothetical protein